MFSFWKSKPKRPQSASLSDEALIDVIRQTFDAESDVVAALFLVAYENFQSYFSVFLKAAETSNDYPASLDGMAAFLDASRTKYSGSSVSDEANARRFFYLYLAAQLKKCHARAKVKPELWDGVAAIWVRLLQGARALRATIDSTGLWKSDETDFFQDVKSEDEGENYCLTIMVPAKIRYHPRIKQWQERDLSPEEKAELRAMEKLFRAD